MSALDPITRRNLTLSKQLYRHALRMTETRPSSSTLIMGVIVFDLAIETALKAVFRFLEAAKNPSDEFNGLLQQCDTVMKSLNAEVPDKSNIRFVHSVRNGAQHQAKRPSETDVSDCRTYTRDFLEKLMQLVWKISFRSVSMAELVSDARTRTFLVQSENYLEQNDLENAVKYAAAGLQITLDRAPSALVGPDLPASACAVLVEEADGKVHSSEKLMEAIKALRATLLRLFVGLDPTQYERFRRLAGNARPSIGGQIQWFRSPNAEAINADNSEWVVSYCVDTALELEARTAQIGALLSP